MSTTYKVEIPGAGPDDDPSEVSVRVFVEHAPFYGGAHADYPDGVPIDKPAEVKFGTLSDLVLLNVRPTLPEAYRFEACQAAEQAAIKEVVSAAAATRAVQEDDAFTIPHMYTVVKPLGGLLDMERSEAGSVMFVPELAGHLEVGDFIYSPPGRLKNPGPYRVVSVTKAPAKYDQTRTVVKLGIRECAGTGPVDHTKKGYGLGPAKPEAKYRTLSVLDSEVIWREAGIVSDLLWLEMNAAVGFEPIPEAERVETVMNMPGGLEVRYTPETRTLHAADFEPSLKGPFPAVHDLPPGSFGVEMAPAGDIAYRSRDGSMISWIRVDRRFRVRTSEEVCMTRPTLWCDEPHTRTYRVIVQPGPGQVVSSDMSKNPCSLRWDHRFRAAIQAYTQVGCRLLSDIVPDFNGPGQNTVSLLVTRTGLPDLVLTLGQPTGEEIDWTSPASPMLPHSMT